MKTEREAAPAGAAVKVCWVRRVPTVRSTLAMSMPSGRVHLQAGMRS